MQSFIEQLRKASLDSFFQEQIRVKESSEKISCRNSTVVCAITMGKEVHAGHLFLLAMADQVRSALNSRNFIVINNNTGPRAAAALCSISKQRNISLARAAAEMDSGKISVAESVSAYRSRRQNTTDLFEAIEILASGQYDIFASVSNQNKQILTASGFDVQIVSESELIKNSKPRVASVSPQWAESGFMPYSSNKRLALLEKGGNLTASGSVFSSMSELSQRFGSDLILCVDSMPDVIDATFVFSDLSKTAQAMQIPGMGVGFNGKIASGTNGEALTIRELLGRFKASRPQVELRKAAKFLTLTLPMSFLGPNQPGSSESFFDFKDNASLLSALIQSSDEALAFNDLVQNKVSNLSAKIGTSFPTTDKKTQELLRFLPQKAKGLASVDVNDVIPTFKKTSQIKTVAEISRSVEKMGYTVSANFKPLESRVLATRDNYYFNFLMNLMARIDLIGDLSADQSDLIAQMVKVCLVRIDI